MPKLSRMTGTAALLTLVWLSLACAEAHDATFVSGKGTDSGPCTSTANPCRTFQFAHDQTLPGGEIKVLDPADYGPVRISKSISITGVDGAGVNLLANGVAIEITAVNSTNLTNLILDGQRYSGTGIFFHPNGFGTLTLTHCIIRNFYQTGVVVSVNTSSPAKFLIADTFVTNNGSGILVSGGQGTLDHVSASLNQIGVVSTIGGDVTAVETTANNNSSHGFYVLGPAGSVLRLARSTATKNGKGIENNGGSAVSFGDNHIYGNGMDVVGALTTIGTR
jgi:hypothetical protein